MMPRLHFVWFLYHLWAAYTPLSTCAWVLCVHDVFSFNASSDTTPAVNIDSPNDSPAASKNDACSPQRASAGSSPDHDAEPK